MKSKKNLVLLVREEEHWHRKSYSMSPLQHEAADTETQGINTFLKTWSDSGPGKCTCNFYEEPGRFLYLLIYLISRAESIQL